MSRIFEALKNAQIARDGKAAEEAPESTDRRRSRRWTMDVAVYVYGYGSGKEPFHEEAHTLNVSANGGLLLLSVPVQKGQHLMLTNQRTQQDQDCRVVFLGTRHSRTIEAGVAFSRANLDFWQVQSPRDRGDDPAA